MQKPHKAYRAARQNHKWIQRNHKPLSAFWLTNIVLGAAILAYKALKLLGYW